MADVKWSNDTAFVPQSTLEDGDQLMGLTSGNVNAKFPVSLITGKVAGPDSSTDNAIARFSGTTGSIIKNSEVTIDDDGNVITPGSMQMSQINVTDLAYLPLVTPKQSYVASAGSDADGDGSIVNPYLTVEHADSVADEVVYIQSGSYDESAIQTGLSAWLGLGKDITQVNCGFLTLNDTAWQAATNPYKLLQDLTVFNSGGAGKIIELNLTAPGSGFTSVPTVGFSGGGGTGGAATAILGYTIASISVSVAGSYISIPTVTATLGAGAAFSVRMLVQSAQVTAGGSGYVVGGKLVVNGGTTVGSNPAVLNIDSIDGIGGITALSVDSGGVYSALPANPITASNNYADCYVATTIPLFATYADGPSPLDPGVGATLTNNGVIAPLFIDGVTVSTGQRVLFWTSGDPKFNGIYLVTYDGSAGGEWEMTRATDFDTPAEINRYARVGITNGNTYAGDVFDVTTARPVQIGTGGSAINFGPVYGGNAQFSISSWGIQAITVTNGGSNYEASSVLSISGGGGGSGTITLAATGNVKSLTLTNQGSGYTSTPSVAITGGGGTGATATATVSPQTGFLNFTPSAYKSGSAYIFDSFRFPAGSILGLASNVLVQGQSEASGLVLNNIVEIDISSAGVTDELKINYGNAGLSSASKVINLDGLLIDTLTVDMASSSGTCVFTISNCVNLDTFTISNITGTVTVNIDITSIPSAGLSLNPAVIINYIDKISPTVSTNNLAVQYRGASGLRTLISPTNELNVGNVLVYGQGAAPNLTSSTTQEVVCIGPLAGASLPNNPANPTRSMFIGYNAGAAYTTSGSPNDNHLAVGYFSLRNMTTAFANTAVGSTALQSLTESSENTAVGVFAGGLLKDGGGQNVMVGLNCGVGSPNASYTKCALLGYQAGVVLSTASEVTLLGYSAGVSLTTGNSNTIIGSSAAGMLVDGANNTVIGAQANVSSTSATNRIAIGQGATAANDNQAVIGNSSIASIIAGTSAATLGTSAVPFAAVYATSIVYPTTEVTGTSQAVALNREYIANNAALVTFTLPATAALGDRFRIVGKGAGLFKVAQNASQQIVFLNQATTSGTGGSITATQRYQVIEVECITANTGWSVTYASGASYTVV